MTTKNLSNSLNSDLEGTVIEVNRELKFFALKEHYVINVAYLLSQDPNVRLPEVGQQVIIKKGMAPHYNDSGVIYVCKSSEINLQTKTTGEIARIQSDITLLKLIEVWKLGIQDLSVIHSNYIKLKTKLFKVPKFSSEQVILEAVSVILNTVCSPAEAPNCLNNVLPKFTFESVCDCKFIDINTTKYEDFPYWSFGVHPLKKCSYLIGYLYIHPLYGVTMLKDKDYSILCMIMNKEHCSMKNLIDSFVLFRNATVITEIYKDSKVPNLEYVVVDFNDITCLKQIQNDLSSMYSESGGADSFSKCFQHYIIFKTITKSVTFFSKDNVTECWLDIEINECDYDLIGRHFLCLRSNYIKLSSVLQEKVNYKLCYNGQLDNIFNSELKRVYPNHKQVGLSKQKAIFYLIKNSDSLSNDKFMNVGECKNYILSFPKELFSFQGRIKAKRFSDPLSSRTERKIPIYGFGTPGSKTHYIEFAIENSPVKTLSVYINNWESSLIPCGLITDMEVIVKNVTHQRGKYCKSTALTSFEIVAHLPLAKFSTVNLFTGNGIDWGIPFFFGAGSKVPYGVLIWAEVSHILIRSLTVSSRCLGCNKETEAIKCHCPNSEELGTKFDLMITLIVTDIYGPAKIISSCPDLLRLLLNLKEHEFKNWCEVFRCIGRYEYNNESSNASSGNLLFSKMLTNAIKAINSVRIIRPLQLCCRKLDSKSNMNSYEPLWFCIWARK